MKKEWEYDSTAAENAALRVELERVQADLEFIRGERDRFRDAVEQLRQEVNRHGTERAKADAAWLAATNLAEERNAQRIAAEAEAEQLRRALDLDARVLNQAQAIMRKHGFKFETRLDLSEGFEKLAFTFYNLLVEVDVNARAALEIERG